VKDHRDDAGAPDGLEVKDEWRLHLEMRRELIETPHHRGGRVDASAAKEGGLAREGAATVGADPHRDLGSAA
jgi:hypothetical protein